MASKNIQFTADAANRLFKRILRRGLLEQGHDLTGKLADSIDTKSEKIGNEYRIMVFILEYGKWINDGIKAENISWKMYPGLIRYFQLRGFDEAGAKKVAALTISKWQKEGMPTKDSNQYSSTGKRTHFIEETFSKEDSNINTELSRTLDYDLNIHFLKITSERI